MIRARLYKVHSRHDTKVTVESKTAHGDAITGHMPCAIIELIPVDGVGHTVTITQQTPTEEDMKAVAQLFAVGSTVEDLGFRQVQAS